MSENSKYIPSSDPISELEQCIRLAGDKGDIEPTAFHLATVTSQGQPRSRVLLYKGREGSRLHFYTNYESDKAHELEGNNKCAMSFHWKPLGVQIRVEGAVQKLSREQSEAYFTTRPRGSQISAWASQQSKITSGRAQLNERWEKVEKEFAGKEVPCPPFWGGYGLTPQKIEIWVFGEDRFHDRYLYTWTGSEWQCSMLSP